MRTPTKKILAIAFIGVMVAAAGCTGWGTDAPADNESDRSDTGDDLEDEQNQSQNQSDSDDSDSDSGTSSRESSTGSDSDANSSDDSLDSSDCPTEDCPDQSDDTDGATDGSSDADSQGDDGGDAAPDDSSGQDADDSSDSSDSDSSDSDDDSSDEDSSDGTDGDDGSDSDDGSDGDNNTGDEPETHELTVAVETPDGEPATGLPVEVVTHDEGEPVASATTDENGNAVFNLENGGYEILVDVSDSEYTHYGTFLVEIDGEDEEYLIPLSETPGEGEETSSLKVTVDNHNGEPVEGASVTVITADGGDEVASGTTDSNGVITFDVENGEYDVIVEHEDITAASRVTVDGDTEDSLTLDTSDQKATGIVKVVDQNGDPVEGEPVTLWPPGAVEEEATETRETDENGEVRIELVAGEPEDVVMFDVVVRDQKKYLGIMADAYVGVQEVVFEVDTTGVDGTERALKVTVVDQNGDPLEGASIHATGPVLSNGAAHEPSGETNADGIATLTAYDGEYDLEVQYDGEITEDHVTVDGDTKTTVEVDTSETGEETNTLTVHAESAVTVESTDEDGMSETQEPTDGVATFEVPDGGYVITADGYHSADLPFVEEDAEITLQDTGGATMDITVTDAESGDPVAGAEISGVCDLHYSGGDSYIETESPSGADGVVTVQTGVTPTTCDATVTADGYEDAQITLDAPDDDGRTVELQPAETATPDPGENETNATVALTSVG